MALSYFNEAVGGVQQQNPGAGQADIWEMNGTTQVAAALVGPNPGSTWRAVGA